MTVLKVIENDFLLFSNIFAIWFEGVLGFLYGTHLNKKPLCKYLCIVAVVFPTPLL